MSFQINFKVVHLFTWIHFVKGQVTHILISFRLPVLYLLGPEKSIKTWNRDIVCFQAPTVYFSGWVEG